MEINIRVVWPSGSTVSLRTKAYCMYMYTPYKVLMRFVMSMGH